MSNDWLKNEREVREFVEASQRAGVGFTMILPTAEIEKVEELREDFPPTDRWRNMRLSEAELKEYRLLGDGDIVGVCRLDKHFFERHKAALTFVRPLYCGDIPGEFPVGLPGTVTVFYLDNTFRARFIRVSPDDLAMS